MPVGIQDDHPVLTITKSAEEAEQGKRESRTRQTRETKKRQRELEVLTGHVQYDGRTDNLGCFVPVLHKAITRVHVVVPKGMLESKR